MTDLLVEIEGQGDPQFRQSVWIRIDEHDPEQWSLGGRPADGRDDRGEICRRATRRIPGIKRAAKPGPAVWRRRGARSPGNIAIRYDAKAYFAAKVTVREPNKQGAMPDGQPGATLNR
ncbi:tautomerase [Klebsiella pneumoniae]|nr:tautomerase [Klebsiella pneumoniae]